MLFGFLIRYICVCYVVCLYIYCVVVYFIFLFYDCIKVNWYGVDFVIKDCYK